MSDVESIVPLTDILIVLFTVCAIVFSLSFYFTRTNPVNDFKEACEVYGGIFQELENVDCKLGHEYCVYNCHLNDETYNLDAMPHTVLSYYPFERITLSYSEYFCVEDCRYINKQAGEILCLC